MKNFLYGAALLVALTQISQASELAVSVQIPALNVAEYHRPYVGIWLENDSQQFVGNLAIWYDLKKRDKNCLLVCSSKKKLKAKVARRFLFYLKKQCFLFFNFCSFCYFFSGFH